MRARNGERRSRKTMTLVEWEDGMQGFVPKLAAYS